MPVPKDLGAKRRAFSVVTTNRLGRTGCTGETAPSLATRPKLTAAGAERLRSRIITALTQSNRLSAWEQQFLSGTASRIRDYGSSISLSHKQWACLEDIFSKIEEESLEREANPFPYADTGGVSYWQKRGWCINRPRRR